MNVSGRGWAACPNKPGRKAGPEGGGGRSSMGKSAAGDNDNREVWT